MSGVYFLSDLHLGHKAICKYRTCFMTAEENHQVIKQRYHSVVNKRSKVFFLGDVAFTKEALYDVKTWEGESKILILGNHDNDFHKTKELTEVFDEVYSLRKYKEFWLSHAPIHQDELRGKVNIHGHTHNHVIDDKRYVNVCMEQIDYTPISLDGIRQIMENRND